MIRTAICEDEAEVREYLAALVRAQPWPCEVAEFASAEDCLAAGQSWDLLLLDVELGGGADGMALAQALRRRDGAEPVLIFVTGHERYVFDAFDVGAFQYLLKPVDEARFAQVFARAAAQIGAARQARALTLQSEGVSYAVPLSRIRYIESANHKVVLYTADGQLAYYAKLRDLEARLQGRFFRIHKGYLVNLACVSGYSKTEVALTSGETLLLSKYKYQEFVKAYLRFLRQEADL